MSTTDLSGSPGSHPHIDRPNWQPAENLSDYLRNCEAGLEVYSDRHLANLMGISRAHVWRMRLVANLPDDLFDLLLKLRPVPTISELASISRALSGQSLSHGAEYCPHCGGLLRIRRRWRDSAARVVNDWLQAKKDST
jgi:hypothetical protein